MRAAAVVLLGLVLATNIYRAATQSVTHDEALTYELFAAQPWSVVFHSYDANHHVLYAILCKIATGILGAGTFSLRLPSLLAGGLFFWTVYRICDRLWDGKWLFLLAVALLALNPYVLDFLSAARGYGMAVAFFFVTLWELLEWMREPKKGRMALAGVALGLSVSANLVLAPPAAGLAVPFLFVIAEQRRTFVPQVKMSKKGAKKAEPNPNPGVGQGIVWFGLPCALTAWFILASPLSNAERSQFYFGAASLAQAASSLGRSSFPALPGWFGDWAAYLALPAILAGSAAAVWRAARNWPRATLAARSAVLTGGALLGAFLIVVFAHVALDVPYPEGRTALYWIPIGTLTALGLVLQPGRGSAILAAPMALCVALYATGWRTSSYADWLYDADDSAVMHAIEAQRASAGGSAPGKFRVAGSWQLEPGVNFYRVSRKLDWMAEMERGVPAAGFDAYVLLPQDAHFAGDLHLKILYRGSRSGTIVAAP